MVVWDGTQGEFIPDDLILGDFGCKAGQGREERAMRGP
jgi:hypothetical protein